MHRQDFYYDLPEHLIAQHPLKTRDQARLMIIHRKTGDITHDIFANIGRYLPPESVLVLNESKVIPARLFGVKQSTGARIEVFVLKKIDDNGAYETLMRPLKRLANGDKIVIENTDLIAEVVNREQMVVRFNVPDIQSYLFAQGHIPLPPYIKRKDTADDRVEYQTVYANVPGSVASPTAGLHFTNELLKTLQAEGHDLAKVTLHINYGTFKEVEAEDITQHQMHWEEYYVDAATDRQIRQAKAAGRKIVAVGTTSCRTLESAARLEKLQGQTNLFLYPGCEFRMVDILVTNFHLPYSTLLMLVSAFGGYDLMMRAYKEAIAEQYRFYSYGDGMIII